MFEAGGVNMEAASVSDACASARSTAFFAEYEWHNEFAILNWQSGRPNTSGFSTAVPALRTRAKSSEPKLHPGETGCKVFYV